MSQLTDIVSARANTFLLCTHKNHRAHTHSIETNTFVHVGIASHHDHQWGGLIAAIH